MLVWGSLTIFFEDPFWVGIWERHFDGVMQVARYVFGAEPTNAQVIDFIQNRYDCLSFSEPVTSEVEEIDFCQNFKKKLHDARKDQHKTIGKKSFGILQAEREAGAAARKSAHAMKRQDEEIRHYMLRREKKKQKKKGH
ncbi:MAG: YjdF family protein [Spirochaetia bacterium]|jgi:hypothetical protein|nr:YjdF family protein [Spirochaetia bacterium]